MKSITRHEISYVADCSVLFEKISDMPEAIWLDSGKPASLQGNLDIMSSAADIIIETRGSHSTVTDAHKTRISDDDPFKIAQDVLDPLLPLDACYEDLPFTGGLIGFFGYDLGRRLIDMPNKAKSLVDLPDMRIGRFLWALTVHHDTKTAEAIFHEYCPNKLKSDVLKRLCDSPANEKAKEQDFRLTHSFTATTSKTEYIEAIATIKRYINSGDCYQTNFTQHFSAPYEGDEWRAYKRLREATASPYSAFWRWPSQALLSMSPERFLKILPQKMSNTLLVETKPIKGTMPRGKSAQEDFKNEEILRNSPKDRAENVMIVDLLRNDISKNCTAGTVRTPLLFALESFPNVHHLVSTVTGDLLHESSPLKLLRDCFPGGSITGAPKKRAMEIIEELEPLRRSIYCGSIGYLSANNHMDMNIAIRTIVASDKVMHCWGGGGIVADSVAENEFTESLDKIKLLLTTLEDSMDKPSTRT